MQVVAAEPGLGFLQDPLAVSAMEAPDMDRLKHGAVFTVECLVQCMLLPIRI